MNPQESRNTRFSPPVSRRSWYLLTPEKKNNILTTVRRNDAGFGTNSPRGANIFLIARKRAEIKRPLSEFTSEKVPTCHQRLVYVFLADDDDGMANANCQGAEVVTRVSQNRYIFQRLY